MDYPDHILQSPLWKEFRMAWGTKVVTSDKVQFTIHPIPHLPWNIGYLPRPKPEDINWSLLLEKAKAEKCVFVKIEPNSETFKPPANLNIKKGKRIFAYATYLINLRKGEDELLRSFHPKTRYNIRLAQKKGVVVKIGESRQMFAEFLDLFHETAKRQKMFNHPDKYYQLLFETFKKQKSLKIVTGYFNNKPLASVILLFYKKTVYYPLGASTHYFKETMPFYLTMWEAIRLGKKLGCQYFDLWNCLLPEEEKTSHPWYGFHRFKKGFNGELIRFAGAYDLILNPFFYTLVNVLDILRWKLLYTLAFFKNLVAK